MSRPIAAYGQLARKVPAALAAARLAAVETATAAVRDAVDRSVSAALPDRHLSGTGTRPGAVQVVAKVTRRPLRGIIRARGPLHLMDLPTRRHVITPRRGTKALKLPRGFVPAVLHPGTRGKRSFARGVAAGERRAHDAASGAATKAMLKGLR